MKYFIGLVAVLYLILAVMLFAPRAHADTMEKTVGTYINFQDRSAIMVREYEDMTTHQHWVSLFIIDRSGINKIAVTKIHPQGMSELTGLIDKANTLIKQK